MKISIITPTFNSGKTLERTIISIINQKYNDLEYIIVDGSSTDNTLDIVEKYQDVISHFISEPDNGISDAYNKGIKIATGELIGIVASDDELLKDSLSIISNNYDGISDVFTGGIIDHDAVGYSVRKPCHDLDRLREKTSLNHPATFIRKDAYERFGLYSTEYKCAIDRELLLRFYISGASFQIVDSPLSMFNRNGISNTDPTKYAIPEDKEISIKYGLQTERAESIAKSSEKKYRIERPLKGIIKKLHLQWLARQLSEKKYLNEQTLKKYLFS